MSPRMSPTQKTLTRQRFVQTTSSVERLAADVEDIVRVLARDYPHSHPIIEAITPIGQTVKLLVLLSVWEWIPNEDEA